MFNSSKDSNVLFKKRKWLTKDEYRDKKQLENAQRLWDLEHGVDPKIRRDLEIALDNDQIHLEREMFSNRLHRYKKARNGRPEPRVPGQWYGVEQKCWGGPDENEDPNLIALVDYYARKKKLENEKDAAFFESQDKLGFAKARLVDRKASYDDLKLIGDDRRIRIRMARNEEIARNRKLKAAAHEAFDKAKLRQKLESNRAAAIDRLMKRHRRLKYAYDYYNNLDSVRRDLSNSFET